jgi:hypothetical protein
MTFSGLRRMVEHDGLSIVVLGLWAVALAVALPSLLVQDTWLDLVDGRLVAEHGLPHVDTLTLWTLGRRWTDQQWGAHLALYGIVRAGGLKVAIGFDIACVVGALAILAITARSLGGSPRTTAIVLFLPLLATPWLAQLRAQTFALVLFAAVYSILALDSRRPSNRVLWVLPLLALWANLHGSVVLGAALATIYGLTLAVRAQTRLRALVLAVGSPLCLLASPYGFRLVAYYQLMLVNPPLKHYVSEWKPPAFVASNAIFFLSAVAVALLWIVRRSTLTTFEQWALPLLALAAFAAGRNTIWFELGAVVAIPRLLNARSQPVLEPASIRRANSVLAAAAIAVALAVCTFQLAHANSRIERNRPSAAAAAVAAAAGSHGIVLADDAHADWLLWLQPSLVGRVAYDVRFELFNARELRRIQLLHDASRPIWRRCGATARVVTFESRKDEQVVRAADALTDRSRTIVSTPNFVAIVQPVVGQDACKL